MLWLNFATKILWIGFFKFFFCETVIVIGIVLIVTVVIPTVVILTKVILTVVIVTVIIAID